MTVGLDDPAGLSRVLAVVRRTQPRPALPGHRPRPGPAALVPAARLRQTLHAVPEVDRSTWARSSTAGSCSSASRKAPSARTPASCSARWCWRRCGRPPPPAPAAHPSKRPDATLIIDEAQNFLTLANSLDTMLAEARKYRLAMTLSHQDLAQFPRELLAAASANARNKIYFSCAPEDARVLARHTLPELDEHDLTHLDAYTAVARLVADGRQMPAFTMKTRPPRPVVGEATAIRQAAAAGSTGAGHHRDGRPRQTLLPQRRRQAPQRQQAVARTATAVAAGSSSCAADRSLGASVSSSDWPMSGDPLPDPLPRHLPSPIAHRNVMPTNVCLCSTRPV